MSQPPEPVAHGVTDDEPPSSASDAIRNARRAHFAKLADEQTGPYRRAVYELLTIEARRSATFCRTCLDDLGDTVWFFDEWPNTRKLLPACPSCFDEKRRRAVADATAELLRPRPLWDPAINKNTVRSMDTARERDCPGCGRRMVFGGFCRSALACSERCVELAKLARRRGRRSASRAGRVCEQCGATFEPPRSDAKTCSAACRQRAYRARRRCVTDAEPDRTPRFDSRHGDPGEAG